jgi:hypothetical protein
MPKDISDNFRALLDELALLSLERRLNAYRNMAEFREIFCYRLTPTEVAHVSALLKKAEEEMRPKANTWYPAEAFKNAGIISPVIAIYKFWSAEQDAFIHTVKAMRDFEYSRDCILDEKLRIELCMRVNPEQLIQAHTSQPRIIAGEGADAL